MRLTAGNSPDALDHSAVTSASQFQKEPTRQCFAVVGQSARFHCPVTVCHYGVCSAPWQLYIYWTMIAPCCAHHLIQYIHGCTAGLHPIQFLAGQRLIPLPGHRVSLWRVL